MIKNSNIIFINCCSYKFSNPRRLSVFVDRTPMNTSAWIHIVVNILPPNQDKIIYVYNNGILANGEWTNEESDEDVRPLNNGQMVVGRFFTNHNGNYGTFKIDELIFFNHALTPAEIAVLSQTTA